MYNSVTLNTFMVCGHHHLPSPELFSSSKTTNSVVKNSGTCRPKTCHSDILIIFSCRYLKNSKCREGLSLNSPYLTLSASKRHSVVRYPLPGIINQGEVSVTRGERPEIHTTRRQTLSQTNSHLCF